MWEHFIAIIIGDIFSSQQIEQLSRDLLPSAGKETTPIATWAKCNGLSRSHTGMTLSTKVSRLLACSRILCLRAIRRGISTFSSCVICQRFTSLKSLGKHKTRKYMVLKVKKIMEKVECLLNTQIMATNITLNKK